MVKWLLRFEKYAVRSHAYRVQKQIVTDFPSVVASLLLVIFIHARFTFYLIFGVVTMVNMQTFFMVAAAPCGLTAGYQRFAAT